jgi:UDP-3-O-[3-hydroxymyristoyl] glucosamine N-acyltransferase
MKKEYSLNDIMALLQNAELKNCENPDDIKIECVVPLDEDKKKSISFVSSKHFIEIAKNSKATALIVNKKIAHNFHRPVLIVDNASLSLVPILNLFYPPKKPSGEISNKASIHPLSSIGKNSDIADFVIIGKNSKIGENCIIEGGVFIGENVTIGDDARIGPGNVIHENVTIGDRFVSFGNCTIGADGFRFEFANSVHNKIPQVGSVIIGSDVEIGANCCIDRGGLGDTILGNGCKFDNMVHIAHNCILKNNIVIAAQTGLAGSTTVGNYVMMSGQCAITDHIEIADGVMLGGKTGIRHTIKEKGGIYAGEFGLPLPDFKKYTKNLKHIVNFQKWADRIKNLEKKLGIYPPEPDS